MKIKHISYIHRLTHTHIYKMYFYQIKKEMLMTITVFTSVTDHIVFIITYLYYTI